MRRVGDTYLSGYEFDDQCVTPIPIPNIKNDVQIVRHTRRAVRTVSPSFPDGTPMSVEMPISVANVAPSLPNTSHGESLVAGVLYRICRAHGTTNRTALRSLRNYTVLWCKTNLPRIASDQKITIGWSYEMFYHVSNYLYYLIF